ncbi:melanoma-associated antigen 8-like [Mustela putorius furo]|uniref:Melanoma-associated antigen 8-like n=2 Tax=Mustela putorius furo TaxID=9669 RepID=A0A8U0RF36_MUSPF|nr:melanoma-associated antigen 8-like [Mustela putorius furo]
MPVGRRNELRKLEEAPQDPREAQRLADAELYEASGFEEALSLSSSPSSPSSSPSSSSSFSSFFSSCSSHLSVSSSSSSSSYFVLFPNTPEEESAAGGSSPPQSPQRAFPAPSAMEASPWSLSEDSSSSAMEEGSGTGGEPGVAEPVLHAALHVRAVSLVGFLLQKFRTKQPTSQAEMLAIVGEDEQDAFPGILGQASECMRLVFGVEVKEVDPSEHSYVLVTVLGLTCDAMLSGEQGLPKTGLLVVLLGVILLEGDRAPEEVVWEALGVMGVYAGEEHIIFGEPRELLTNVWVQEGYLEYQQVPGGDPARYEFLWGPRAHMETSRVQVLEYLLRVYPGLPVSSLVPSEEAVSHEEEGA